MPGMYDVFRILGCIGLSIQDVIGMTLSKVSAL